VSFITTDDAVVIARETVRMAGEHDNARQFWPATVVLYDPARDIVEVIPDGIEAEVVSEGGIATESEHESQPAGNISDRPYRQGQRVMLRYQPPHGLYVVGSIGQADLPGWFSAGQEGITSSVETAMKIDNIVTEDDWGMAHPTDDDEILIRVPGVYIVHAFVTWQTSPGTHYISLHVDGEGQSSNGGEPSGFNIGGSPKAVSFSRRLDVDSAIQLVVFQSSGGARTADCRISVRWVGW
jgi:hypothetical protein